MKVLAGCFGESSPYLKAAQERAENLVAYLRERGEEITAVTPPGNENDAEIRLTQGKSVRVTLDGLFVLARSEPNAGRERTTRDPEKVIEWARVA